MKWILVIIFAMELRAQSLSSLNPIYLKNLSTFERGWAVVPDLMATPVSGRLSAEKILSRKNFHLYKKNQMFTGLRQMSLAKTTSTFIYPVVYHPHHQRLGILTGKVVIKLKNGVSVDDLKSHYQIDVIQNLPHLKSAIVKVGLGLNIQDFVNQVKSSGLVDKAEAEILSEERKPL